MQRLLLLAIIGFAAQFVDGAMGMAYGVTSASLLLMFGIAPAIASATIHLAEVVTTAASGAAHLRFGNVDKDIVKRLIIPGSIGAFVGACFLSKLPGNIIKPYIAIFLFILGLLILIKFLFDYVPRFLSRNKESKKYLTPLGLGAGFLDAIGGGGWGPLTTPVLLTRGNMEVRKVVGSVDTSEFAIAVSATFGFLLTLGWETVNWQWIIALMLGGIVAAPLAAWMIRIIPQKLLGVLVGGVILLTNAKTIMSFLHLHQGIQSGAFLTMAMLWVGSIVYIIRKR